MSLCRIDNQTELRQRTRPSGQETVVTGGTTRGTFRFLPAGKRKVVFTGRSSGFDPGVPPSFGSVTGFKVSEVDQEHRSEE